MRQTQQKKSGSMIDVHAHILPGVDDGARDFAETSRLLRFSISQGFGAVIATPHGSRGNGGAGIEKLAELTELARQEIQKEHPDFELYLGQETRYHEELPQKLREGKACTMAGSRYVLVEFETGDGYSRLLGGIRALSLAGFLPVLAHVERYGCLRQDERLEGLAEMGCVFQMNYGSLQGSWLSPRVRWCRRQVCEGRIQLLGTDMHRTDYRPPDTAKAMHWLEKNVREELVEAMTRKNALHMIRDEGMD